MATRRATNRTKRRVEDTEPSSKVAKMATHRGTATVIEDGTLEITYQSSELVPVAQYANVTIGPIQLRWQTQNPGIEKLGTVDWEAGDLTPEQQEVYDIVRGWLRATSRLIEHHIADDRELVEESVRVHNEREAEEQAAQEKRRRASSRR